MKGKHSFQSWILTGCLLVAVCTLILVAVLTERSWREQLVGNIQDSIQRELVLITDIVGNRWRAGQPLEFSDELAEYIGGRLPGTRITLIAPDGRVLGDSQVPRRQVNELENHGSRPEVLQAMSQGLGVSTRYSVTLQTELMYVAQRLDGPKGPRLVIRAAVPLSRVREAVGQARNQVLGAVMISVLLALVVAYVVSRTISRPVNRLTQTAAAIAGGNLSRRFTRLPSRELRELGRALDRMAATQQKKIDDLARARDRLEGVLRGMVEGVLLLDSEGEVLLANRALSSLLGVPSPAGRPISESIRNPELLDALKIVREGQGYISREITTQANPPRYLQLEAVRLPGQDSQAEVVAVLHDITEHRRTEQLRRDFVANVSHELRTPLTAIRASAETLLDGAMNNSQHARQFVEMIQRHTLRLEALARDLLDLSRLESAQAPSEWAQLNPGELIESVRGAMKELAFGRGVKLDINLPSEPVLIRAERRQLEQALINLVDNAIKYTETGGRVTLGLETHPGEVHLVVSDDGVGIEPEHLPRLFERFYRVNRDRSRELGGTGLGLAIVKHVALAHGGRVEVDSTPGQGSTFRLILPLEPERTQA